MEATIIVVNVQPQDLAGDLNLMRTMPVSCSATSLEWRCVMNTKGGVADAFKRTGVPVCIVMQNVEVKAAIVTEAPEAKDVYAWHEDKKGCALRSAVFVPRFPDFGGQLNHTYRLGLVVLGIGNVNAPDLAHATHA